jgi:hypothetical protein
MVAHDHLSADVFSEKKLSESLLAGSRNAVARH